jgi:hypothetical protein
MTDAQKESHLACVHCSLANVFWEESRQISIVAGSAVAAAFGGVTIRNETQRAEVWQNNGRDVSTEIGGKIVLAISL